MNRPRLAAGVAAVLCLSMVAAAPTAKPPDPSSVENLPVRIDPAVAARAAERQTDAATAQSSGGAFQVVAALVVVIAVILGLRWAAARLSLVPNRAKTGAVKVVGRSVLSAKQQVLLIQVGRRLIVVGDSGGAMSPLCEITDADEVASLIGEAKAAQAGKPRPAGAFDKLFRGAAEPFQSDDDRPAADDAAAPEVGGLLDRVRGLRRQFGQA